MVDGWVDGWMDKLKQYKPSIISLNDGLITLKLNSNIQFLHRIWIILFIALSSSDYNEIYQPQMMRLYLKEL
jgi:hypothetical protein